MKKALFIYGYGGSPESSRFKKLLEERLSEKYEMHCIKYTQEDCPTALDELSRYVLDNGIDLVVGTSLGGFLVSALEQKIKAFNANKVIRVLINPCLLPTMKLRGLEPRPGHPEDVKPSETLIDSYDRAECILLCSPKYMRGNVYGFFAKDDDLLGDSQMHIFAGHYGQENMFVVRGKHHGTPEEADDIAEIILNKL